MSCNCNNNLSDLPELPVPVVPSTAPVTPCCSDECSDSTASEGSTLAESWTDAGCCTEMVLLGRSGNKLVRFIGSGFIKLTNGVASIVNSVPIKVTSLWHRMYKIVAGAVPSPGEPLPFPYFVVADDYGNLHGIRGEDGMPSIPVWDGTEKTFSFVSTGDLPACKRGSLEQSATLELVGFAPLTINDASNAMRCQRGLSGKGILVLSEQETVNGPVSVATALANPPDVGTYVLKVVDGTLAWVEEEV